MWRTTRPHRGRHQGGIYFNPRPPCGGRHDKPAKLCGGEAFQSTSSVWRTTPCAQPSGQTNDISIHVLRVEDDSLPLPIMLILPYFNPRPPCGGRHTSTQAILFDNSFQSTSSVWRTTYVLPYSNKGVLISIHVLRVEDDLSRVHLHGSNWYFNPRPPCGGRPYQYDNVFCVKDFNPRPPCGGRHIVTASDTRPRAISIHVLRVEDDCKHAKHAQFCAIFQSTSSVWRTTAIKRLDTSCI